MRKLCSLLAVLALTLGIFGFRGVSAEDEIGVAGRWNCQPRAFTIGRRLDGFTGDSDFIGAPLPDGPMAGVSVDTKNRSIQLWMYDNADAVITVQFDKLEVEPGTVFPTGRFDPQGDPTVIYHGGQLKILGRLWDGGTGKGGGLYRIYTWCGLQ